jgi:arsenate reductase
MVDATRVLFLCTHNAARSQIAEALLRHYAGSRFAVSSAGLAPTAVHAFTRKVLEEIGIDTRPLQAKSLSEFLGKVRFHYAIIVCQPTEEHCPQLYPFALQTLYWPFDDPVQADSVHGLHKFREVRDQIATQLRDWLHQSTMEEDEIPDNMERLLTWDREEEGTPEHAATDTKESIREQPDRKTRAWARWQFFLGIIQMLGAAVSVFLLVQTGVSTLALSAVVLTCVCTTVSVLLFGSHHREGKKEPR